MEESKVKIIWLNNWSIQNAVRREEWRAVSRRMEERKREKERKKVKGRQEESRNERKK